MIQVRNCFSKKCKTEYALKVIDKAKCQGKEHMIESEVKNNTHNILFFPRVSRSSTGKVVGVGVGVVVVGDFFGP